jgi:hypothetical protein
MYPQTTPTLPTQHLSFPSPPPAQKKGTIFKTSILQTTIAGENSNPPPKFGVGRRSESAVAVACCMQLADFVNPFSICAQYFFSSLKISREFVLGKKNSNKTPIFLGTFDFDRLQIQLTK